MAGPFDINVACNAAIGVDVAQCIAKVETVCQGAIDWINATSDAVDKGDSTQDIADAAMAAKGVSSYQEVLEQCVNNNVDQYPMSSVLVKKSPVKTAEAKRLTALAQTLQESVPANGDYATATDFETGRLSLVNDALGQIATILGNRDCGKNKVCTAAQGKISTIVTSLKGYGVGLPALVAARAALGLTAVAAAPKKPIFTPAFIPGGPPTEYKPAYGEYSGSPANMKVGSAGYKYGEPMGIEVKSDKSGELWNYAWEFFIGMRSSNAAYFEPKGSDGDAVDLQSVGQDIVPVAIKFGACFRWGTSEHGLNVCLKFDKDWKKSRIDPLKRDENGDENNKVDAELTSLRGDVTAGYDYIYHLGNDFFLIADIFTGIGFNKYWGSTCSKDDKTQCYPMSSGNTKKYFDLNSLEEGGHLDIPFGASAGIGYKIYAHLMVGLRLEYDGHYSPIRIPPIQLFPDSPETITIDYMPFSHGVGAVAFFKF